MLRLGLVALGLVAVGLAAAQAGGSPPVGATDRVLLLQAKRFEGIYKLVQGEMVVKVGDDRGDWKLESGATKLEVALAPKSGKPDRATFLIDGRTVEGTAAIDGKTLTLEFKDGKTAYRFKLTLSGRNDGELKVTKDESTLVASTFKRT